MANFYPQKSSENGWCIIICGSGEESRLFYQSYDDVALNLNAIFQNGRFGGLPNPPYNRDFVKCKGGGLRLDWTVFERSDGTPFIHMLHIAVFVESPTGRPCDVSALLKHGEKLYKEERASWCFISWRLRDWSGQGPVPGTGVHHWCSSYRHPKTIAEMRMNQSLDEEPKARASRIKLPTSYDDIRRHHENGWKNQGKKGKSWDGRKSGKRCRLTRLIEGGM